MASPATRATLNVKGILSDLEMLQSESFQSSTSLPPSTNAIGYNLSSQHPLLQLGRSLLSPTLLSFSFSSSPSEGGNETEGVGREIDREIDGEDMKTRLDTRLEKVLSILESSTSSTTEKKKAASLLANIYIQTSDQILTLNSEEGEQESDHDDEKRERRKKREKGGENLFDRLQTSVARLQSEVEGEEKKIKAATQFIATELET